MEVKNIKAYSFWNAEKKCDLTLTLGCVVGVAGNKGLRWKLKGKHIPFPVRSNTWFCGCDTNTMLEYLNNCGYELEAVVNLCSGDVRVFPRVVHETKYEFINPNVDDAGYELKHMIVRMANESGRLSAMRLIHAFYGISLHKAQVILDQWLDELS